MEPQKTENSQSNNEKKSKAALHTVISNYLQPRVRTHVSYVSCTGRGSLPLAPSGSTDT